MRDDLDKTLCEKYPKIFRDRHGRPQDTNMCWGFQCDDGWFNILDRACGEIQHHIDHKRKEKARILRFKRKGEELADWQKEVADTPILPQVVALQVKEKFGTLRFYVSGGDEFTDGVLRMAEAMSGCTCENCGIPGKLRGGGWVRTLCDRCVVNEAIGFEENADDNDRS